MRLRYNLTSSIFPKFNFSTSSSSKIDPNASSSFQKLPKKLYTKANSNGGFWGSLFGNTFLSETSYNLSYELFEFLQETTYLEENFPFVQENTDLYANLMALHVVLLRDRMLQERTKGAQNEANNFLYYCKTTHFLTFAKHINTGIPSEDFREYYQENYSNRVEVISTHLDKLHNNLSSLAKEEYEAQLATLLRKIILMNFFKVEHTFCQKVTRYYVAHKSYLSRLNYIDLVTQKINWGLQADPRLLEQQQKHQPNGNQEPK